MSDEPKKSNSRNNRGGGRGGRGGRGRGGRGGGRGNNNSNNNNDTSSNSQSATNFAGRGPKNFDGGRGRGGGNGPRHMGNNERSRPDRICPKLPTDDDDDEEVDENNINAGVGSSKKKFSSSPSKPPPSENEHVDHIQPINPISSPTNKNNINDSVELSKLQHEICMICFSSKLSTRRTITPCGHDDICWTCQLQMRYLHSDTKCPVCKANNEMLIVDTDKANVTVEDVNDGTLVHHKRYNQYNIWGNELPGFIYREDVGMFFPTDLYERYVVPLLGYGCGLPYCEYTNDGSLYVNEKDMVKEDGGGANKKKQQQQGGVCREVKKRLTGLKALKAHLRIDHGYALCDLCVDNKRDFVSKLVRYTPSGLKQHQSKGDGEHSGFAGHPLCEFCRPLRFYDIVKLHEHLNKEHYKCHICDKQGKPNQFFKDYTRLERHFDRDHYLCHDTQCLSARFVVFENEIDLRAHESSVHGTTRRDGGTKIKLEFRVRRDGETLEQFQNVPSGEDFQFGLNGEAFVPDALPGEENDGQQQQQRQINEPDISHPVHAARTAELRAIAATIRERDGTGAIGSAAAGDNEAFPLLGMDAAAAAGSNGMLVGWTSDGARTAGSLPGGLKKTAVGKVTDVEFPSLGGASTTTSKNNRYAALGLGKKKSTQQAARVGNFSAVASRPTSASSTNAARPFGSASYSASLPTSAPNMNRDNFPSLGGGSKPSTSSISTASSSAKLRSKAPNLKSSGNFPSLGGGASRPRSAVQNTNPYAAAQAHARKLNAGKAPGLVPSASAFPALSSDFPPPPNSNTTKKSNVATAFAPKKPPPMDNVLQFPPPSSKPSAESLQAGKETVQSLKQILGTTRYKKLKSLTKDFANGETNPETYVDEAASLFDQGIGDKSFWDNIPALIQGIPNDAAVSRAMQHLESVRMANQMQTMEFSGGGNKKKPINYILPTKKKTNSWANNNSSGSQKISAATKLGPGENINNTQTKQQTATVSQGTSKKSKAKKKNNELKSLAFGV